MSRAWRVTRAVVLGLSLVSFFFGAGLHAYFGMTLPTEMDLAAGRVYALNHHGRIVFLTRGEMWLFVGAFAVAILGVLCVLVIQVLHRGGQERINR